ncbi:MAG: hypothetical protein ACK55Z_19150, partial [bacterium]
MVRSRARGPSRQGMVPCRRSPCHAVWGPRLPVAPQEAAGNGGGATRVRKRVCQQNPALLADRKGSPGAA